MHLMKFNAIFCCVLCKCAKLYEPHLNGKCLMSMYLFYVYLYRQSINQFVINITKRLNRIGSLELIMAISKYKTFLLWLDIGSNFSQNPHQNNKLRSTFNNQTTEKQFFFINITIYVISTKNSACKILNSGSLILIAVN